MCTNDNQSLLRPNCLNTSARSGPKHLVVKQSKTIEASWACMQRIELSHRTFPEREPLPTQAVVLVEQDGQCKDVEELKQANQIVIKCRIAFRNSLILSCHAFWVGNIHAPFLAYAWIVCDEIWNSFGSIIAVAALFVKRADFWKTPGQAVNLGSRNEKHEIDLGLTQ